MMNLVFKLFAFIFFNYLAFTQTIHNVPADYPTIQLAFDVAQAGDTILVQPGVYYENLQLLNKNNITIKSAGDTSNTFVDGVALPYTTLIISGSNNLITGFTIRNGRGGVLNNGANIFENLLITNNYNDPGITTQGAAYFNKIALIRNSSNNNAGFYTIDTFKTLINNSQILFNAGDITSGLYIGGSNVEILNSQIAYNVGPIIQAHSGNIIIKNTQIFKNNPSWIYLDQINFLIENCVIADFIGGSILSNSSDGDIINTIFCYNGRPNYSGGAIRISNEISPILSSLYRRNIFFDNHSLDGDAIYCDFPRQSPIDFKIDSCIFFRNGYAILNTPSTHTVIAENNWWGDTSGPYHPTQNPNGAGDSVNVYVDITPYSSQPFNNTPLIPADSLQAININTSSADIIWEQSILNRVIGYKYYISEDSIKLYFSEGTVIGNNNLLHLTNLIAGKNYYLTISCYDSDGNESWHSRMLNFTTNITGIDGSTVLNKYFLEQNYPNPFNPSTKIIYQLLMSGKVTLKVYDVLGKEVATLVNEQKDVGSYEVEFNASSLTSGIYFYKLQAGSFVETKKMILMK